MTYRIVPFSMTENDRILQEHIILRVEYARNGAL